MIRVDLAKWNQTADNLRDLATESPHPRSRERFLALYLMVARFLCASAVARELQRENETVLGWVKNYNEHGPAGLVFRHTGGPRPIFRQRSNNKSPPLSRVAGLKITSSPAITGP